MTEAAPNTMCRAERDGDRLTLETGVLTAVFRWNDGHLVAERLAPRGGREWQLTGAAPDAEFPGQLVPPAGGAFSAVWQAASPTVPAHLRVEVATRLEGLDVRRIFRLFPGCPMIGCRLELRGAPTGDWRAAVTEAAALANIESAAAARQGRPEPVILHRIWAPHGHLDIECAELFDITDRRNNLTAIRRVQPYRQPLTLRGNVLLARDRLEDRGLVLLKEAPCSDVQLASPGYDFVVRQNEIQAVGIGLMPEDLDPDAWTAGYGFAIGAAAGDEDALLAALHRYQACQRAYEPRRDGMILLNTWGDRGEGKAIGEAFALREIEAGARLGVTHFQLDHGWETTQAEDKTWPLNLNRIWDTPHFWNVHKGRFPNGLGPVVAAARRAGIELCLWFNPSREGGYEHWRDDAEALIRLHREYGIRTFKIDGVEIPDKGAEIRLRRMLETVAAAAGGDAVFNLDITAGRRFGYFYFSEYGNKFLENRYTDWTNYYPHWTLRNLWMLSRYVAPRTLQVEFLNRWRNAAKYPAGDPLAPSRVPFDYCFAIAMPAQPLAWFEAAQLPDEAFAIAPLVWMYRAHQSALHAGVTLPVGEEPSGTGWTGFQTDCGRGSGYALVFRELNERETAAIRLRGLAGRRLQFRRLGGSGRNFQAVADTEGRVTFSLPGPFTFGWYAYMTDSGEGGQ